MPRGFGVRVDSSYEMNNMVTTYYDSMLCKICCHDHDKIQAVNKMLRAIDEMRIEGISSNKEILIKILKKPNFLRGAYTTTFIDTQKQSEMIVEVDNS